MGGSGRGRLGTSVGETGGSSDPGCFACSILARFGGGGMLAIDRSAEKVIEGGVGSGELACLRRHMAAIESIKPLAR